MSGGGSKNATQTTRVELPEWMQNAGEQNFMKAESIANNPYTGYDQSRIAGYTPDQVAAQDMTRANAGQTGNMQQYLGGQAAGLNDYQPQQVQAGQLASTNLDPYMNPYTQQVEAHALSALESQRKQAQLGNQDAFLRNKAFGGSRQALQAGVTDAMAAQKAAETSANIRAQAFQQAQNAASTDIGRAFDASRANQSADLQGRQLGLQGLQLAGNLYGQGQQADIRDVGLLSAAGQEQQAMNQAQLDLNYQNWMDYQGWDRSQLEWLSGMLGSSPGSQTTNATGNMGGSKPNPAMGALGGALSGAATGSMAGPWGAAGGAVIGAGLGYMGSR